MSYLERIQSNRAAIVAGTAVAASMLSFFLLTHRRRTREEHRVKHRISQQSTEMVRPLLNASELKATFNDLMEEMKKLDEEDKTLLAFGIVEQIRSSLEQAQKNTALNAIRQQVNSSSLISSVDSKAQIAKKLLKEFENDEGWNQVQDSKGIKVLCRIHEGESLYSFRTECILRGPFIHLIVLLIEADLMTEWMPMCSEAEIIAMPSKYRQITRIQMDFPRLVPISNRDMVLDAWGIDMLERNAFIAMSSSIESSPVCTIPPPKSNVVRITSNGGFYMAIIDENHIDFRATFSTDMKLAYAPPWLINFLNKNVCADMVTIMQKKLDSFAGSPWEARLREKRSFYEPIEQRIQEYLQEREKTRKIVGDAILEQGEHMNVHSSNVLRSNQDTTQSNYEEWIPILITFLIAAIALTILRVLWRWFQLTSGDLLSFATFLALLMHTYKISPQQIVCYIKHSLF